MKGIGNRLKGIGDIEQTIIERQIPCPRSVTLTLSLPSQFMSSAHNLTKRSIWLKLNENR